MQESSVRTCPACGNPARPKASFCLKCGVGLGAMRPCFACQLDTSVDAAFCDRCGADQRHAPLPDDVEPTVRLRAITDDEVEFGERSPARPPPSGAPAPPSPDEMRSEKRLVTVLFADISGFTAMSETLDPEVVTEIMNRVFERLSAVVVDNGGAIDKYIGDCIMAVFGAPRSFGDDAERAARAALAMQEALAEVAVAVEATAGTRLQMRIGLNTGVVLAGYVGGAGFGGYTVMGDTVNLASRMESACEKGRVLASANTCRFIAERFVVEDSAALRVKGKAEAVQASYVARERRRTLMDRRVFFEGQAIPLVGRSSELGRLEARWLDVRNRKVVRTVVVAGACGVGKTRLIEAFCQGLAPGDSALLYGRQGYRSAGYPMLGLRRALVRGMEERWGGVEAGQAALEALVGDGGYSDFAGPASRLAATFVGGGDPFGQATGEERAALTCALFWGLARLIQGFCVGAPAVLVLANGHLADTMLVDFVRYLSEQGRGPLLLLIEEQRRVDDDAPVFGSVLGGEGASELTLKPLPDQDIVELATRLLAPCDEIPAWVGGWISERSEGTPFFAIEQLRVLRSLGVLSIDADTGAWRLALTAPGGDHLPDTLTATLQANLDARADVERHVLQCASVVGSTFWDEVVVGLLSKTANEQEVRAALASLSGHHCIQPRSESAIEGLGEYRFESDLFLQACYDSLTSTERRDHHARTARLLTDLGFDAQRPGLVASHFELGGDLASATRLLLHAAHLDLKLPAFDEARRGLRRAEGHLEVLVKAPGTPASALRVEHRYLSAELHWAEGDLDGAMACLQEGFGALSRLPVGRTLMTSMPGSELEVSLWRARGRVHKTRGAFDEARKAFELAIGLLERRGEGSDDAVLFDLRADLEHSLAESGCREDAAELARAVIDRFEGVEPDSPELATAVARHCDIYASHLLEVEGQARAALHYFDRARQLRCVGGNPLLLSVSDNNRAAMMASLGDTERAAKTFERALKTRQQLGHKEKVAIGHLNLGECLTLLNRLDEARLHLDAGRALAEELGATPLLKASDVMERQWRQRGAERSGAGPAA